MITQETLQVEREMKLLKICDMCELNEYTKKFKKIYIKASKSIKEWNLSEEDKKLLNIYFLQLPWPWGQKLFEDYQIYWNKIEWEDPNYRTDTLGMRTSFVKRKISEWCKKIMYQHLFRKHGKKASLCCYGEIAAVPQFSCHQPSRTVSL